MKKGSRVLAALLAVGLLLGGCAGKSGENSFDDPKGSSIYVTEEGTFSTATVENFDSQDPNYELMQLGSEDDWKAYLEEMAAEYNGEHGEGAVTLKSCGFGDGTMKMIFDYATGSDLVQFTKTYEDTANEVESLSFTTVEDALSQAAAENALFIRLSDGKSATTDEIAKKSDYHVVVVEGTPGKTQKIKTEGKIAFVSNNVTINSSYAVETKEGKSYIIFK